MLLMFKTVFTAGLLHHGNFPRRNSTKLNHPVYDTFLWNGIDCIDSSKGYVEGNVVPCCKSCNEMKSSKSSEDFLRQVEAIHIWQQDRNPSAVA